MITIQQNKSKFPFDALPEPSSTAYFNPPDWHKTSVDEASDVSDNVLISAAQAGQEWAFDELCFCRGNAGCSHQLILLSRGLDNNSRSQ
jgi:hypothetical protein